ncbi:MAG TPA: hypothetical protein VIU14_09960 [Mesorhizobium sp.]
MSMLSSERLATERASFPEAGPFVPVQGDSKAGNEMWRAVLTSLLALYPVLAAVAVALVSLSLMGSTS